MLLVSSFSPLRVGEPGQQGCRREASFSVTVRTCSADVCLSTGWARLPLADRTLASPWRLELQGSRAQPCRAVGPKGNPTTSTRGSFQKGQGFLRILLLGEPWGTGRGGEERCCSDTEGSGAGCGEARGGRCGTRTTLGRLGGRLPGSCSVPSPLKGREYAPPPHFHSG